LGEERHDEQAADNGWGTGNGSVQVLTVHGQISAGEHVAAGAYADTIAVTVIY
jgi:spore coat protein U-like protein